MKTFKYYIEYTAKNKRLRSTSGYQDADTVQEARAKILEILLPFGIDESNITRFDVYKVGG